MSMMSELDRALREQHAVIYGDGPTPAPVQAGRPARMGFSAAWYAGHLADETLDQTADREVAARQAAEQAEAEWDWRTDHAY